MNRAGVLRLIVKGVALAVGCCCALALAAASWYVIEFYPRTAESFEINTPDQPMRILVATQGSEFKDGLVAAICDRLRERPVYVKVIDVGGLDEVDTAAWGKVLVINTAMMNVMSGPARRLVARGERLGNVLLFVTSGGADFKPADLAVDALSGASRKADIGRLADLVLDWIAGDPGGDWMAGDQVLALEYLLQVDVGAACAAIQSEQRRYQALYPNLESRLNSVGYDLLRRGLLADALRTFELNRDLFPGSWNVYDSYADALLASGDRAGAIANCRKSVELNPDREAGRRRLAELKSTSGATS